MSATSAASTAPSAVSTTAISISSAAKRHDSGASRKPPVCQSIADPDLVIGRST
jgi:hypothetical protein